MSDNIKAFFDNIAADWDRDSTENKEDLIALINTLPIEKNMAILDIGCGTGIISHLLYEKSQKQVHAIDLSAKMIAVAKSKQNDSGVDFEVADFLNLPDDQQYDFAIIFNAYPHFLNPSAVADKLNHLVRQNKYFAILHNCSREKLASFHRHCQDISRTLLPVDQEKEVFSAYFNFVKTIDDDRMYLILGQKK